MFYPTHTSDQIPLLRRAQPTHHHHLILTHHHHAQRQTFPQRLCVGGGVEPPRAGRGRASGLGLGSNGFGWFSVRMCDYETREATLRGSGSARDGSTATAYVSLYIPLPFVSHPNTTSNPPPRSPCLRHRRSQPQTRRPHRHLPQTHQIDSSGKETVTRLTYFVVYSVEALVWHGPV